MNLAVAGVGQHEKTFVLNDDSTLDTGSAADCNGPVQVAIEGARTVTQRRDDIYGRVVVVKTGTQTVDGNAFIVVSGEGTNQIKKAVEQVDVTQVRAVACIGHKDVQLGGSRRGQNRDHISDIHGDGLSRHHCHVA